MNAAVERWLETIRQRALTKRLGQVTCRDIHGHDYYVDLGARCSCGAQE